MFRVSTIFKNSRLDKELELNEISKKLKIPAKYLEALEDEKINNFPQEPYCSLIVKDYANFLGLNGEEILSLFRRDFAQKNKTTKKGNSFFVFTPQFTFKMGITLTVIFFSGYLIFEYLKFNRPPELKVNWPETEIITDNTLEIIGFTDPESTVRINQDLVIVDATGSFKKKIILTPPESKIVIESKSANGKTTIVEKIYK
jgi:hypothetical protein